MAVSTEMNLSPSLPPQSQIPSDSQSPAQTQIQFQPQPYAVPSSPGPRKRSNEDLADGNDRVNISTSTITATPTATGFGDNKENQGGTMESNPSYDAMDVDSVLKSTEVHPATVDGGNGTVTNTNQVKDGLPLNLVPNLNTGPAPGQGHSASSTGLPGSTAGGGAMPPAPKKRKLSPASREAKQQEKEAKEKQRLEEKAKKEEEKKAKEEEKRKKDAEREEEKKKREAEREEERKRREEKKKVKEEEKLAKDEEKRKKEEEKLKKERAQTRLNAFFAKPKVPTQPRTATPESSPKKASGDAISIHGSPRPTIAVSDYQRAFPEFFLQSHTSVAPSHRFQRDPEALTHTQSKVDSYLKAAQAGSCEPLAFRPAELFQMIPYRRRRGKLPASVRDILLQIQSLSDHPESSGATQKLQDSLKYVRMKSLKFGEDVRPPYQGTYSKSLPECSAARLMRNPFRRELPDTNYDYDSEAEWEEPEEGEDLDSEEEDEGSEEGDDDMDGFLDDEDDQLADGKRRLLVGELESVCSGIRWQDQGVDPELQVYKIETILPTVTFPIDPFSAAYWQKPKPTEPAPAAGSGRSTLHAFMGNAAANQPTGGLLMQEGSASAGKPKRAFPVDQLDEFRQAVEGSDLTKTGLIEILKKRFPKVSKDILKDTLNRVAARVGQKEADKKWVCK